LTKAENLRNFFADPANQTTRERIFFNRLSFDLKIAAAREGYHLHLYEPDVDRDGFDIVAEDEDTTGWFQTKAVLSSAGTSSWDIFADLLWPSIAFAEGYGFDPAEAGRGGGVILIEIDDETTDGQVLYSYTDFNILVAIAEGYLIERPWAGRGRPAVPARPQAKEVIEQVRRAKRGEKVSIPKKMFVRLKSPDDLIGVMGLRSTSGYCMYAIRSAYSTICIDQEGKSAVDAPINVVSTLHYNIGLLQSAQPQGISETKITIYDPFVWVRPTS
jgi:hypothetical protein